jgi:hypothetical protein
MTAPAPSTLSIISGIVRQRLLADPFKDASNFEVSIDTPAAASKTQQASGGKSLLNLFFYRIEPSGFYDSAGGNDRWYVRAQCLITPFSADDTVSDVHGTTTIPQGEIDLRVLGEVLRYFHENPIIVPQNDDEKVAAGLQIVLNALSSQEINQIWATQGEVPYRSSLLYEFALVPITPKVIADPSLPVVAGGATTNVRARLDPPPPVKPSPWPSPRIETGHAANWAPALAFVVAGTATQSATLGKGTGTKLALWLAGPVGANVDLVWEQVDQGAWTTVPSTGVVANVTVPTQAATPPGNEAVDPDNAAAAVTIQLVRPTDDLAQLLLYARRTMPDGSTIRSNPLIVSIVAGGP